MWKDAAVCLSLANLCYLRVWSELLTYTPSDAFLMKTEPSRLDYAAAALNMLLLGGLLWLLLRLARRARSGRAHVLLRWGFLLFLLIPLNAVRNVASNQSSLLFRYLRTPVLGLLGETGLMITVLVLAALFMFALLFWHRQLARAATVVLLIASPLAPVVLLQAAWSALHDEPSTFADKTLADYVTGEQTASARVLWVLFDEWDQRLTFENRPSTLRLPEIERFRERSLHAENAYPPGWETQLSVPSLITGRLVTKAEPQRADKVFLNYADSPNSELWANQRNVFSEARRIGVNSAVVGWYLPYCRLISGDLTQCSWWEMSNQYNSMGQDFTEILRNQPRSLLETVQFSVYGQSRATLHHIRTYKDMLEHAKQAAGDPRLGLTFLHLPVPHSPHSYDGRTGQFTLRNSPIKGYYDSLALVDLTLGELRRSMERAGTWETTTILLSSDHCNRSAAKLDGKSDRRVPFVLHFAGQQEGRRYEERFNTLLTGRLLIALLRGEVTTPVEAENWLDIHRLDLQEYGSLTEVLGQENLQCRGTP